MRKRFHITGMSCSACSSRIEKVVSKLEGVSQVDVNLLTNSMQVEIDREERVKTILQTVEKIGYGASEEKVQKEELPRENKKLGKLIVSIVLLLILMYFSMGHMLLLPMPAFAHHGEINALIQIVLTIPILWMNRSYFIHGFQNLVKLSPNMDSLIAIGASAAFFYGIYAIIRMWMGVKQGNMQIVEHYSMQLYFESSAMIVTLISLGKYLEERAKGKTTQSIQKLIRLAPETATILRDGKEIHVLTKEIQRGDIVIVKPGERIPIDGVVKEGESYIDQSAITGESMEVKKQVGDQVMAATINKNGALQIEAQKVGEDTTLAQIIQLVENASSSKAPIGKLADKISGIFVPVVIGIAILATIIWLFAGKDFEFALSIGIAVLVISCPCALGLATPVSIMVGTGKGAEYGILIKSAESLENAHKINAVVLDKTGTITQGKAKVTDMISMNKDKNIVLQIAASIEKQSNHPLGRTILEKAQEEKVVLLEVKTVEEMAGRGLKGSLVIEKQEETYLIGNLTLMKEYHIVLEKEAEKQFQQLQEEAKTVILVGDMQHKKVIGEIAIQDEVKKDSKQAIQTLQRQKVEVVMLTGDNKKVAIGIGKQVGIDPEQIEAEVLPQEKEKVVRQLQEKGKKVAMVGDGINDSPALARADVGIAIGAGTDIAIESADIVLIKNSLKDVINTIKLSKSTVKNIKMSLFWAFFYNTVGIPIAAGVLYPSFGFTLNPMIAAACMSLSSVSVVLNALRLRKIKFKEERE